MRNIRSERAWRFIHANFKRDQESTTMEGFSVTDKGIRLNHSGGIETTEKDDSIRQAILLLLSTRPSERVMRPDYGCDLHKLVFAPCDETTAGLAIHYVKQALTRWEPRVEIIQIDATKNEHLPECLDIQLEYQVRNNTIREHLKFSFSLTP